MPVNNKHNTTREHDQRNIDLFDEVELRYWCRRLGINKTHLLEIVRAVGPDAEKVHEYLRHNDLK